MSEKSTISKLHGEIHRVKPLSVFSLQIKNKQFRSSFFQDVVQCRFVVSYWLCGTIYWSRLQESSSPRRMSKISETNYQSNCMTSQKGEDFIYTMVETCNHKPRSNLWHSTSICYECIWKHAASLWLTPTHTHTFRALLVGEIDISQCSIYEISQQTRVIYINQVCWNIEEINYKREQQKGQDVFLWMSENIVQWRRNNPWWILCT